MISRIDIGLLVAAVFAGMSIIFLDADRAGISFTMKLLFLLCAATAMLSIAIKRFFGTAAQKRIFINIALFLTSAIVTLLAAEWVVRIAYKDVTSTSDNSSYFTRRWQSENPVIVNSLGFRERPPTTSNSTSAYRIAIIGDSFAYGQGVDIDERFSNRIHRILNERYPGRFEVLNFGRPGAETDEHLRILDGYVVQLSPDFILLQWFVNDVEVLATGRDIPLNLIPSAYANNWLHRHSALYYLLNFQWHGLQYAFGWTETYIDNLERRFADPDGVEWRMAEQALDRFVERADEIETPVGIVLFPMMVDSSGNPSNFPAGFLMDRVIDVCRRREIPCLDLRHAFSDKLSATDLWANRLDHHPGSGAHRVAADEIIEAFMPLWSSDLD